MSNFRKVSKSVNRDVSRVASWMMKRNVTDRTQGELHYWRWQVLTKAGNPRDTSRRPTFNDRVAQDIFDELQRRDLLLLIKDGNGNPVDVDGSGVPAYLMNYDLEGWDKAVSDGRPLYGAWLKIKRNWWLFGLMFLAGAVVTALENRTVGLIDKGIDFIGGKAEVALEKPPPPKAQVEPLQEAPAQPRIRAIEENEPKPPE